MKGRNEERRGGPHKIKSTVNASIMGVDFLTNSKNPKGKVKKNNEILEEMRKSWRYTDGGEEHDLRLRQ